jgi:Tol biopolymer transport system component
MTTQPARDDFDLLMAGWMEADAQVSEPVDLIDRVLDQTARTRRTPAWLLAERWVPAAVGDRLHAAPRLAPAILVLALLLAALLAIAFVAGSRPRLPAPFGPAANGQLVFDTFDQIYAVNPDGTGARPIVAGIPRAAGATYAPDGTRFVFWGNDQPDSLYVGNSDGTGVRKLVGDLWISTDKSPSWSPDSRYVAISTESGPDRIDEYLVIVDTHTGTATSIRSTGLAGNRALLPAWSPDGQWIVFEGIPRVPPTPTESPSYWLVRPDGSGVRRIPTSPLGTDVVAAHWAPDARRLRIAYSALGPGGAGSAAYVFDLATNRETRISSDELALWPAWSPDGSWLAWLTGAGPDGVRIASVEDPLRVRTLDASGIGHAPAWSPDGRYIFGLSGSRTSVVVLAVDGSAPAVSIPHLISQALPDWQRLAQ